MNKSTNLNKQKTFIYQNYKYEDQYITMKQK